MASDTVNDGGKACSSNSDGAAGAGGAARREKPWTYLLTVCGLVAVGLASIFLANGSYAPEMYRPRTAHVIGKALANGENYAVFDLNVNIRDIRSAQIASLKSAPDVVLVGASQWQEAHGDLMPNAGFLNVHVHRDYYEDLLAMSEVFVANNKLPRTMVIAIRDALFSPLEERRDHLWLPAVANYRAMAKRLDIEPHSVWETLPLPRVRDQISMPMLFNNVTRWYNAEMQPGTTLQRNFGTLDTLLPEGSIVWSQQHRDQFTTERSRAKALSAAAFEATRPHGIDPKGVEAVDALFGYLTKQGVEIVIAFPPFNPIFFEFVRDKPFIEGLHRLEAVSRRLADKYRLRIIGSFDPAEVGCTAEMYIDAEHSNSHCLSRVLEQLGPGSLPPKSQVVAELEQPIPTNDLARQQLLILQNGRAQASLAGVPEIRGIDVILAGAEPVEIKAKKPPVRMAAAPAPPAAVTPAIAAPAAKVQSKPRVQRRAVATRDADSDRDAETDRAVGVRTTARRERPRSQRPELVWPGDPGPGSGMGRRQRFSSADR